MKAPLLNVFAILAVTGCTVAPAPVTSSQVEFTGNQQNAGLLGRLPDGSWHLSTAAKARYDLLIAAGYGKAFTPPLKVGDGCSQLPDGSWSIDQEHLVDFGVMATAKRSGIKP